MAAFATATPDLDEIGAIMNTREAAEPPHWMQSVALSGSSSVFNFLDESPQAEQRRFRRVPRSVGIVVQPLDEALHESDKAFFAITRDISHGGLAYLSPRYADFDIAVVHMEDEGWSGEVVCRVCNSALVHTNELEQVYLTNLEYLYERFM
ncbi:MAG: PilZ domain-containing protein [Planctomycetota bacterium]